MYEFLVGLTLLLFPPSLCDVALDTFQHRDLPDAGVIFSTCTRVVESALVHNIDPFVAVSTCEEESKCRPNLVSTKGAQGPLQVTRYWCVKPMSECNLVNSGVRALKLLRGCKQIDWDKLTCMRARKQPVAWEKALCHYNGGNKCGRASRAYAKRVVRDSKRLRKDFKERYE